MAQTAALELRTSPNSILEEKNLIHLVIASIVPRNNVNAAERRFALADPGGSSRYSA